MSKTITRLSAALVVAVAAGSGIALAQQQKHPGGAPAAPRVSAPAAPRISAPAAPHFSAPSAPHFTAAPRVSTPHFNAAPRISAHSAPVRSFSSRSSGFAAHTAARPTTSVNRQAFRGGPAGRTITRHAVRGGPPGRTLTRSATGGRLANRSVSRQALRGGPASGRTVAGNHLQPNAANRALQPNAASRALQANAANRALQGNPSTRLTNRSLGQPNSFGQPNARNAQFQQAFRDRFRQFSALRFADRRRFHGGFIGWFGPVFWPYAYDDMFYYAFWPADYDDYRFWTYAYDDVFTGVLWPGSYDEDIVGGLGFAYEPARRGYGSRGAYGRGAYGRSYQTASTRSFEGDSRALAQVCSNPESDITQWPIDRIAQAVNPTDAQHAALDGLKAASEKAMAVLKNACPTDIPATPLGRLDAMAQRVEAMLQAVNIVRPALATFYDSLNDDQKARFNVIGQPQRSAGRKQRGARAEAAQVCGGNGPGLTERSARRIERAVRPAGAQLNALDDLKDASARAVDTLRAACPAQTPLTPTGRLDAMANRLEAMLSAVKTVRPALAIFWDKLSDEQKAQFNAMAPQQG